MDRAAKRMTVWRGSWSFCRTCRGRREQAAPSTEEWKKAREDKGKVPRHLNHSQLYYTSISQSGIYEGFKGSRRDTCSCPKSRAGVNGELCLGFARQLAGNYRYSTHTHSHIHICLSLIWLLMVKRTWQALPKQATKLRFEKFKSRGEYVALIARHSSKNHRHLFRKFAKDSHPPTSRPCSSLATHAVVG